jgi:DNA-binding transcriptional regulator PaaX
MANRAQEAATALLKVFAMFKFTPQQVIKIGSLAHLVEMFGVSEETVPDGLQSLLENDLLVREGEFDLYLTELGWERMHDSG